MKTTTTLLLFLVLAAAGCQPPDPSQKLKPLIEKSLALWNTGDVSGIDAVIDPHYVRHENQQPDVEGIDGLKKAIAGYRAAFPDFKVVADEVVYTENTVTMRWTVTGTNTGPGQMPPTGRPVKVTGVEIMHVANGKLTDQWVSFDNQSVMQQLGFTLTPPATAKP